MTDDNTKTNQVNKQTNHTKQNRYNEAKAKQSKTKTNQNRKKKDPPPPQKKKKKKDREKEETKNILPTVLVENNQAELSHIVTESRNFDRQWYKRQTLSKQTSQTKPIQTSKNKAKQK